MKEKILFGLILFAISIAGCAGNGISVLETTPDGGTLTVKQSTFSMIGAKTKEGAGDFVYTGTASDGSTFDMRAGAAVTGQETPDPTTAILGVVNTLAPIMSQKIVADAQPTPPEARDARLTRLENLIEELMLRWPAQPTTER